MKSGFLLKKGARSSNYTKPCVVLLPDRMVIYENVGDSNALVSTPSNCDHRLVSISRAVL